MKRKFFLFAVTLTVAEVLIASVAMLGLVLAVVLKFMLFGPLDPHVSFAWIGIGGLLLTIAPAGAALVFHCWAKRKIIRFKEAFHVHKSGYVAQWEVDDVLAVLALEMHQAFMRENEIHQNGLTLMDDEICVTERDVAEIESWRRKNLFWEAHGLARLMGFEVHPSYKDYFTIGRRPQGEILIA